MLFSKNSQKTAVAAVAAAVALCSADGMDIVGVLASLQQDSTAVLKSSTKKSSSCCVTTKKDGVVAEAAPKDEVNSCCWKPMTEDAWTKQFGDIEEKKRCYRTYLLMTGQQSRVDPLALIGTKKGVLDWKLDPLLVEQAVTGLPMKFVLDDGFLVYAENTKTGKVSFYSFNAADGHHTTNHQGTDLPMGDDVEWKNVQQGEGELTFYWKDVPQEEKPKSGNDPRFTPISEIAMPLNALAREIIFPDFSEHSTKGDAQEQARVHTLHKDFVTAERIRHFLYDRENPQTCCRKEDECFGKNGHCEACANAANCNCCQCCATFPKCCQDHACLLGYVLPVSITGAVAAVAGLLCCLFNGENARKMVPAAAASVCEEPAKATPGNKKIEDAPKKGCSTCCWVLIAALVFAAVIAAACACWRAGSEEEANEEEDMETEESADEKF